MPIQAKDKRNKFSPIPKNLDDFLNENQRLALKNLRQFGTDVQFVRRPAFVEPTVVLMTATGKTLGMLDRDGNINNSSYLLLRAS
jgi:hypothetical protein